jgi:hypothetical protein
MAKAVKESGSAVGITLPPMNLQVITITVVGDSALITHAWSKKAKSMMLAKQMKQATAKKEAKNPEKDYEESLYRHPAGGFGFPSVGFKAAMVSACRFADGVKMTELRGALHIVGDMVKIEGDPAPREDMVRVGMGTADIRYRAEFKKWRAKLTIQHNASVISAEQIANLLNVAGFGVGVGEWRPERNGSFGRFHVASNKEAR